MDLRPSPEWGPQGDPWSFYINWLSQAASSYGKGRVRVGDWCFSCEHGGPCPEMQRQVPVKACCRVAINGEFSAPPNVWGSMARVYFNDAVPLCSVCHELYDWDPSFTMWLRQQYTDFRSKGAE